MLVWACGFKSRHPHQKSADIKRCLPIFVGSPSMGFLLSALRIAIGHYHKSARHEYDLEHSRNGALRLWRTDPWKSHPLLPSLWLLQNGNLRRCPFLKVRNSGRNHEIIVVSTAKALERFSKKAILQQSLRQSCFPKISPRGHFPAHSPQPVHFP